MKTQSARAASTAKEKQLIKVLVWDLDNTLWDGTLLEGDNVHLQTGARETLEILDQRGILFSIASKNDSQAALQRLEELGVKDYFLYPQIHWGNKSGSLERIAAAINIGLDAVALIDDQAFERDEVEHALPQVRTFDAAELERLAERPELMPRFITDESAKRRHMLLADMTRNRLEEDFTGPKEDFLRDLDMRFTITPADQDDLKRAEELTVRTNQLNTSGYTYTYEELDAFRRSPDHLLLIASLEDRYGTYGKIGLALIEKSGAAWTIRLLLMSCRVMSRGVGSILINYLLNLAKEAEARLLAEFKSTRRNRMMLVTYTFAGFKKVETRDELTFYEHDLQSIQPYPDYVVLGLPDHPA